MTFVDIAGLVAGAAEGKGMGNAFLTHVRSADAILHVVRCFDDGEVHRADGGDGNGGRMVDPAADAAVIDFELLVADLQAVERALQSSEARRDKLTKGALTKLHDALAAGIPVRRLGLQEEGGGALSLEEWTAVARWPLLTGMPCLYVANVGLGECADPESNPAVAELARYAADQAAGPGSAPAVVGVCASLAAELVELEPEEQAAFAEDLGLPPGPPPGPDQLIQAAYSLLGLVTFLTTGEVETRAWRLRAGQNAAAAGRVIHTDIGDNLVKVEVCGWEELVQHGGWAGAKSKGVLRSEGKDYIVADGDCCVFLHSK